MRKDSYSVNNATWDPVEGLKLKQKSKREIFIENYRAKHASNWNEEVFALVLAAWDDAAGTMVEVVEEPPVRAALASEWDPKFARRQARWDARRTEKPELGCKPWFTNTEYQDQWDVEVPAIVEKYREDKPDASEDEILLFLAELGYIEIHDQPPAAPAPAQPTQAHVQDNRPAQHPPAAPQAATQGNEEVSPYAIAPTAPKAPPQQMKLLPPNGQYAGPPPPSAWEPEAAAIYAVAGVDQNGVIIPGKAIMSAPAPVAQPSVAPPPVVDVTRLKNIAFAEAKMLGG